MIDQGADTVEVLVFDLLPVTDAVIWGRTDIVDSGPTLAPGNLSRAVSV